MSQPTSAEQVAIIAAAEAAADEAFHRSLVEIERVAASAPDWSVEDDASGKKLLSPKGQMARGMLAHLRRCSTALRPRREPAA